jgi:hypothetical protein
VSDVLNTIGDGFEQSFLMAYEVWWALVLGFAISAIVQAWVPRERIEGALAGSGFAPVAKATGLGAASSSCSYRLRRPHLPDHSPATGRGWCRSARGPCRRPRSLAPAYSSEKGGYLSVTRISM